jgi:hypothetical protein
MTDETINVRMARLEERFNGFIENDFAQLTKTVEHMARDVTELTNKSTVAHERLRSDYCALTQYEERVVSLELRVRGLEKDIEVAKVKWTSEFSPVRLLVFGAVGVICTGVLTALLSFALIKAQISPQQHAPVTTTLKP